ncbi:MAG: heparan-alpha-glucosaminide N-acetyltransferase domain-containing protein [Paludibacter sp.]|nr:heparan-alpha-glucosaminide N-acetyltransferase domain-containing protein [Paludibacter sp.]
MAQVQTNSRLLSLDVLRGITIAGMILVNNPGSWSYKYAPLGHAPWHGLTPTDLVFPFFMFIMGISTYISLRKFNFEWSKSTVLKILKRTVVIFVIGMGIAWLSLSFRTFRELEGEIPDFLDRLLLAITNFENLRILGVLQRLALSYGATALIAILVKHKYIPHIIVLSLIGYFMILLLDNGFEFSEQSIIAVVDRAVLGINHMYVDSGVRFDPEGLLSTIPSIAHVLIGFYAGMMLMQTKDNYDRIRHLFILGAILTFAGFLLSYGCPINKKIWSPTFVLATCGLASTLLALLIWIIDIKGHKRWSRFFESFGVNPLFIYVAAAVFSILLGNLFVTYAGEDYSIKNFIYEAGLRPYLGDYFGSFVYAALFVGFNWIIGNILYKKQIYIKI